MRFGGVAGYWEEMRPDFARNTGSGRENVGAPTLKVILEGFDQDSNDHIYMG